MDCDMRGQIPFDPHIIMLLKKCADNRRTICIYLTILPDVSPFSCRLSYMTFKSFKTEDIFYFIHGIVRDRKLAGFYIVFKL